MAGRWTGAVVAGLLIGGILGVADRTFEDGPPPADDGTTVTETEVENAKRYWVAFVEASGDTNAKNSEREVSFETVPTLEPGQSVEWKVVAKVNREGSVGSYA